MIVARACPTCNKLTARSKHRTIERKTGERVIGNTKSFVRHKKAYNTSFLHKRHVCYDWIYINQRAYSLRGHSCNRKRFEHDNNIDLCMSAFLSFCPFVTPSVCLHFFLSAHLKLLRPSVCFMHPSVCLSVFLLTLMLAFCYTFYTLVCLYLCLAVCFFISLSVRLPACMSVCLSFYFSVHL